MQQAQRPTRRSALQWLCLTFGLPTIASRALANTLLPEFEVEAMSRRYASDASSVELAHYTVHATISLLGVTLISKQGVGGAVLQIEESRVGSAATTALQFCAGSWPERLRGFNRFGMTQEIAREESGRLTESAYLSFMTSSPEKDMTQARQAYREQSAILRLSASQGRATEREYFSAVDRVSVPGQFTWFDCPEVVNAMRGNLSPMEARGKGRGDVGAFPTFLHAVKKALADNARETEFQHNGSIYRLSSRFAERENSHFMQSSIHASNGRQTSQFRVWFDARRPAALPLSFEFKPRSFLTLRFEQTEPQPRPLVRPLLKEVSA